MAIATSLKVIRNSKLLLMTKFIAFTPITFGGNNINQCRLCQTAGCLKTPVNVHFRYECCMDTSTGLPISDSMILIECDYVDISTVYYDHLSRKDSSLIYSKKTDTIVGPKNIYDILSGFYHYRANYLGDNLPLNHSVSTTTFFIDEIWDLTVLRPQHVTQRRWYN